MSYIRTEKTLDLLRKSLDQYRKTKKARNKTLYSCWWNIKNRCYNQNNKQFKNYGGRGIVMCDEWLNDYWSFENWSLEHGWKIGLQIDRIDNNGIYEPSNCRWVTALTNMNNTRFAEKYFNDERTPESSWDIKRAIRIAERAKAKAEKIEHKKIVQVDPSTNTIIAEFITYVEAGKAVGGIKQGISNAIHCGTKYKGYYWRPKYNRMK